MYAKLNIAALSCNHCCSGKAVSIAYSECVFAVLVIQRAKLMRLNKYEISRKIVH